MAKKSGKKASSRKPKSAPKRRSGNQASRKTKKSAPKTKSRRSEKPRDPFSIVGVGASAGGLEAFTALLEALPTDTGMAFVLIQHMDPSHESMLKGLLERSTKMSVVEAADGMRTEPNHIYVIPPNAVMTIREGTLHLGPRRRADGPPMPIDAFFQSLAQDRGNRAIGVILSDTGSDGTAGLKAIKAEGGITFAQDEKSAKFAGMPGSAVAAGHVDFVMPPKQIAEELQGVLRHPYVQLHAEEVPVPVEGRDLNRICSLLHRTSGVDFTSYKPNTIQRRIARRMALNRIERTGQYVSYLQGHPDEAKALYEDLLIHVTEFFREPKLFETLKKSVFPRIMESRKTEQTVRLWVPGCSTGEEVYSLAIALFEFLGSRAESRPIQLFGTDISESAIAQARTATYLESSLADVSEERRQRFFAKVEDGYQLVRSIRDTCVFARHNLAKDPPFSHLDLISCRNVLIYLGSALQKKIMTIFHYSLKPAGFLVVGKSESLTSHNELFSLDDQANKVFTKKPRSTPYTRDFFEMTSPGLRTSAEKQARSSQIEDQASELLRKAEQIIWDRSNLGGLIVDSDLRILHFRGATQSFLDPSPGEASFHVMKMVRQELQFDVRTAIQRAGKTGASVRREGIQLELNGGLDQVSLEVVPMPGPSDQAEKFLILFQSTADPHPTRRHAGAPKRQTKKNLSLEQERIGELETELRTTRESLQSIVEEEERGSEELRAANEEILSSNEELQSTNEELETAKEELQSANEELVTVNEEQLRQNASLSQMANDLTNLLNSVDIPVVMLGIDRCVRHFTPPAKRIFNLIESDIGRPIQDLSAGISVPDWQQSVTDVIEHVQKVETEVRDDKGRWHLFRMFPYKTAERKIDGVVIVLVDITDRKRAEEGLAERYQLLAETARDLVCMHETTGACSYVGNSSQELLGYSPDRLIGRDLVELVHRDDQKQLRRMLQETRRGKSADTITYRIRHQDGRYIWFETLIQPILDDEGKTVRFRSSSRDVTQRLEAEQRLRESEARLQSLTEGLLESQEAERRRIARELHDDFNQRLAALAINLGRIRQKQSGKDEKLLRDMEREIGVLSDHIRETAHQLHPAVLDHLGLAEALDAVCREFSGREKIKVRFKYNGLPATPSEDVSLCLYRIVHECLRNIAKHSQAKEANVVLTGTKKGVRLRIEDRGRGFDPEAVKGRKGLGIISMKERVELVGGTFQLDTRPGGGVRVIVDVPVEPKSPR